MEESCRLEEVRDPGLESRLPIRSRHASGSGCRRAISASPERLTWIPALRRDSRFSRATAPPDHCRKLPKVVTRPLTRIIVRPAALFTGADSVAGLQSIRSVAGSIRGGVDDDAHCIGVIV